LALKIDVFTGHFDILLFRCVETEF